MGEGLKHFFFFSVFIIVIFLTACSQSTPELSKINYSVIFECENKDSLPDARLCVFAESNSDVRRYDRIKLTALENGYIWDTKEINRIFLDEKQWAGNTNFRVPEYETLPSGIYEAEFFNADEKQTSVYFTINYDESLYDLTSEEIVEKMKSDGAVRRIAIYNNEDNLIYYGEKLREYDTPRGIWNSYRQASYYYDIWCTPGDYVICIMPEQKVALDNE